MSEHDADMYADIAGKVRTHIQALRVVMSSIEVLDIFRDIFFELNICCCESNLRVFGVWEGGGGGGGQKGFGYNI